MSNYSEDVDLAISMHDDADTGYDWKNLTSDEKVELIRQASAINQDRREQEAAEAALKVKYAAVDAYRVEIAGTVPAHRLDTRQRGFLDGWEAAMAHIEAERAPSNQPRIGSVDDTRRAAGLTFRPEESK